MLGAGRPLSRGGHLVVITWCLCAAAQAVAQPGSPPGPPRGPGDAAGLGEFGMMARMLEFAPEDYRAPSEAEAVRLKAFAAEHLPELARKMRMAERVRPDAFGERFDRIAPYLRYLARLRGRNPELFTRIKELVSHVAEVRRLRFRARSAAVEGVRKSIVRRLRAEIEKLHDVRIALLEDRVTEMEQTREERVTLKMESLLESGPDLWLGLPEPLVQTIWDVQDSEPGSAKHAAKSAKLRSYCSRLAEREERRLAERLARMRRAGPEQVDRMLRSMLREDGIVDRQRDRRSAGADARDLNEPNAPQPRRETKRDREGDD